MDVKETITYNFSGSFNGILRDINLKGSKGVTDLKIYSFEPSNPNNSLVIYNSSSSNLPGTYIKTVENNVMKLKIFSPSRDQQKTFVIEYTILQPAKRYQDVAELYWIFVGKDWACRISNITVNIKIPEEVPQGELRVFAHGPLTGNSRIIDGKTVQLYLDSYEPGQFVEARVLFPQQILEKAEVINSYKLNSILQQEKIWAEEANAIREQARRELEKQKESGEKLRNKNLIGLTIGGIAVLLAVGLIGYIYIKYDKELKPEFNERYYRELPGDYTPAEMGVLMYPKEKRTCFLTATLMDLVRKKVLILEVNKKIENSFFHHKEVEDYVFRKNPNYNNGELKKHEESLIKWFIDKIGDGEKVSFKDINNIRGKWEAMEFQNDYNRWFKDVKEEAEKNSFFDDRAEKGRKIGTIVGFIYLFLSWILLGFISLFAIVMFILGFIMIGYSSRITQMTKYGNDQFQKWKAFKRFLKDFSLIDQASVPSLTIWEQYLVYAIPLGVAKEVLKQLKIILPQEEFYNQDTTPLLYATAAYGVDDMVYRFDNLTNALNSSVSSIISVANSSDSSSSGSGGGFSSGGGDGGGGGGGGAF